MLFESVLIILAAVLPAVVLLCYIVRKDTYMEPLHLLLWTYAVGMLSVPCALFFANIPPATINASPFVSALYMAFVQAAIPEELAKFLLLFALIWNNRHFDELFDGIVYASLIGLGFATVENVMYITNYGTEILLSRGVLAVPGHFFFGVAMGFFFGLAKGFPKRRKLYLTLTLLVPILLHGIYDALLMCAEVTEKWLTAVLMIVFYAFVILLWKNGIKKIKTLQGK